MRYRRPKDYKQKLQEYQDYFFTEKDKIQFQKIFPDSNSPNMYLEIGMGRGDFITKMAARFPEHVYIGIEKQAPLLLAAAQKIKLQNLTNVKLMNLDATHLLDCFEQDSIHGIYLNFSDPWLKNRYHKRRLTHSINLEKYEQVLINAGTLHFKTDNLELFQFSIEHLNESKFRIVREIRDLYNLDNIQNVDPADLIFVQTEYEKKFVQANKPIYAVDCILDK